MGNENTNYNNSNIKYVNVNIEFNSSFLFPGEILTGIIKLSSKKVKFNSGNVTFRISQSELWNIPYIKSSVPIINNLNYIINNDQPIIQNNLQEVYRNTLCYKNLIGKDLSKGEILQFNINLPTYILPSFEYSMYDKKAFIRTFIDVIFNDWNVKKTYILIIKKPITSINSPLSVMWKGNSKLLGLFKSDDLKLEVNFPSNTYTFFNVIPLTVNFTGKAKDIKYMYVKLIRRVKFLEHGKKTKYEYEDILFEQTENNIQNTMNLFYSIPLMDPVNVFNKYDINFNQIQMNDRTQMINFIPSVNSSMIICEYFIKVKAKLDSLIHKESPFVEMPIDVNHVNTANMNYYQNNAPNGLNAFNNQLNQINQNGELPQDFPTEAMIQQQQQQNNPYQIQQQGNFNPQQNNYNQGGNNQIFNQQNNFQQFQGNNNLNNYENNYPDLPIDQQQSQNNNNSNNNNNGLLNYPTL